MPTIPSKASDKVPGFAGFKGEKTKKQTRDPKMTLRVDRSLSGELGPAFLKEREEKRKRRERSTRND